MKLEHDGIEKIAERNARGERRYRRAEQNTGRRTAPPTAATAQNRTWRSRLTGPASSRSRRRRRRLEQVPFAAPRIDEHRNKPIGLAARRFKETRRLAPAKPRNRSRSLWCGGKSRPVPPVWSPTRVVAARRSGTASTNAAPAPRDGATTTQRLLGPSGRVLKDLEAEDVAEKSEAFVIVWGQGWLRRRDFRAYALSYRLIWSSH